MKPPTQRSKPATRSLDATGSLSGRTPDALGSLACLATGIVLFLIDQATKLHAEARYLLAAPSPTMAHHRATGELLLSLGVSGEAPGRWSVQATHVANAGVMLGFLEEAPFGLGAAAFHATTLLALAIAVWLARTNSPTPRTLRCAAALLTAGVLSNLLDRLRLGYVVDWIYLQSRGPGWQLQSPAFNVGDLLIVVGLTAAAAELARRAVLVWRGARATPQTG